MATGKGVDEMSGGLPVVGRCAEVFQQGHLAGRLEEVTMGGWRFSYESGYEGLPVSLTMPTREEPYQFERFPAVFDGLLPEGLQLEALLRKHKIDRNDYFRQLMFVGEDMVGSVTVRERKPSVVNGRDQGNA